MCVVSAGVRLPGVFKIANDWLALGYRPHQERMSRAFKVVGGAQWCAPRGSNGEMLCTSSRSGVQEIMRTIVAVAVRIILREARLRRG